MAFAQRPPGHPPTRAMFFGNPQPPDGVLLPQGFGNGSGIWDEQLPPLVPFPYDPRLIIQDWHRNENGSPVGDYSWEPLCLTTPGLPGCAWVYWDPFNQLWGDPLFPSGNTSDPGAVGYYNPGIPLSIGKAILSPVTNAVSRVCGQSKPSRGGWSTLKALRSFGVPHPSVLRVRVLTLLFLARHASAKTIHPAPAAVQPSILPIPCKILNNLIPPCYSVPCISNPILADLRIPSLA
jgi:hypothetical protein